MAFSTQNGGSGGGRRRGRASSLSEINVVPLVDVVLVLLVIFMLTAHVMEFGMEVDVPKVKTVKDSLQELPLVTITKGGELYLNEKQVNVRMLAQDLRQRFPNQKAVYLRVDRNTIFDPVAQVISILGDAGFAINVVTQLEDSASKQ